MEVELLHIYHGDKKKKIDTATPEGKNEVDKLLKNLCEQKCAVFLERGKATYRVVGYDKETDELIIERPRRQGRKPKDYPASDRAKLADYKAVCRVEAGQAKVAAVAPVAGGAPVIHLDTISCSRHAQHEPTCRECVDKSRAESWWHGTVRLFRKYVTVGVVGAVLGLLVRLAVHHWRR
jgi:hypothetical protein